MCLDVSVLGGADCNTDHWLLLSDESEHAGPGVRRWNVAMKARVGMGNDHDSPFIAFFLRQDPYIILLTIANKRYKQKWLRD